MLNDILRIAIGSDHAGYMLKEHLKNVLTSIKLDNIAQVQIVDYGCNSTNSVDYPDYAFMVAKSVATNTTSKGILICGSGSGMAITANKVEGIRAVNCYNAEIAALSVQHNDANILCLGARFLTEEQAIEIAQSFLNAQFEGGRHQKRVDKIKISLANSI